MLSRHLFLEDWHWHASPPTCSDPFPYLEIFHSLISSVQWEGHDFPCHPLLTPWPLERVEAKWILCLNFGELFPCHQNESVTFIESVLCTRLCSGCWRKLRFIPLGPCAAGAHGLVDLGKNLMFSVVLCSSHLCCPWALGTCPAVLSFEPLCHLLVS